MTRRVVIAVCLAGLVLANYLYRRYLEHAPTYLFSFVDYYYPGVVERLLRTAPWRLFLPIPEMTGSWTTTTLIVTHVVERLTSPATAWFLFNAILIVASFLLSWWVLRSLVFSFTFALLMGFGTPLYHTYAVSGAIGFCLLFVYYELLLACAVKLLDERRTGTFVLFGIAAVLTVLSYEGWLDFLVFTWGASLFISCILWRARRARDLKTLAIMECALTLVGIAYVYVKVHFGYGQTAGSESDVVFNYPMLAPAVEDVFSNIVTHLYVALTAFLPPVFLSSPTLFRLGGDGVVALQNDYHAPFSYLVPMHYLFFWRYFAGAAFVLVILALVKTIRRSWLRPSPDAVALSLFLIMIGTGGPTHSFIKFRPMNSAPVVTYHVMVGVLGAALLISYLTMMAWRDVRNRRLAATLVAAIWAIVLYSSLTRPAHLSALAAQVGLGEGLYPDPLRAAAHDLGIDLRTPPGEALYQLQHVSPIENAIGLVVEGASWLPELGKPLPGSDTWKAATAEVELQSANGLLKVRGDTSQIRYQLVSPPVAVPRSHGLVVHMRVRVEAGRVCAGVLDQAEARWIVMPVQFRQEIRFNSGDNERITLVIANCNRRITENDAVRFTLYGGSYDLADDAGGHVP
jgi:hypothetical protein